MSRVDSGLGWSCDSAYFVKDAGTYMGTLYQENRTYWRRMTKDNDTPGIVGWRYDSSGYFGVMRCSTDPNIIISYVASDGTSGDYNPLNDSQSVIIDGTKWYFAWGSILLTDDYDNPGWPLVDGTGTREEACRRLLEASGVITYFSQQTIPVQFVRQGGGIARQLQYYRQRKHGLVDCHSRKGVA